MKRVVLLLALIVICVVPFAAARTVDIKGECLADPANVFVNGEPDHDGDGIMDGLDNCPCVGNPDQADQDNNGIGDQCDPNYLQGPQTPVYSTPVPDPNTPSDGNVCNGVEPSWVNGQLDSDSDGVPDTLDNCRCVRNADQTDTNNDGIGNACTKTDIPEFSVFGMLAVAMLGVTVVLYRRT